LRLLDADLSAPFSLLATDPASSARRGTLSLPHGIVETPIFMPVGEDPLSCKRVKVFLKGEVQQAEKLASLHDEGKGFLNRHQIL
jgi:hypothetical protein